MTSRLEKCWYKNLKTHSGWNRNNGKNADPWIKTVKLKPTHDTWICLGMTIATIKCKMTQRRIQEWNIKPGRDIQVETVCFCHCTTNQMYQYCSMRRHTRLGNKDWSLNGNDILQWSLNIRYTSFILVEILIIIVIFILFIVFIFFV